MENKQTGPTGILNASFWQRFTLIMTFSVILLLILSWFKLNVVEILGIAVPRETSYELTSSALTIIVINIFANFIFAIAISWTIDSTFHFSDDIFANRTGPSAAARLINDEVIAKITTEVPASVLHDVSEFAGSYRQSFNEVFTDLLDNASYIDHRSYPDYICWKTCVTRFDSRKLEI